MGRALVILGILFIIWGMLLHYKISIPYLGKLPGDFLIKGENYRIYFPFASSILISIILSILFYFFFNKRS